MLPGSSLYRVVIDYEKCKACGACVKACPMGVLEMIDEEPYPVDLSSCHGCGECANTCPQKAIKVVYMAATKA